MSLIVRDDGKVPTSVFEELGLQHRPLDSFYLFWALGYWDETKNPFYLDYVQVLCSTAEIEIGPLLQAEFLKAASERLRRAKLGLKQPSSSKAQKNLDRIDYLINMAQRVHEGESQLDAAGNVIDRLGAGKWEVDTLVKAYSKLIRKADLEKVLFNEIDEAFPPDDRYYP